MDINVCFPTPVILLYNYIDSLDSENLEAAQVTLRQCKKQASATRKSSMQYVPLSIEVGRRHHVKKQGWVYAVGTVILQREHSGKEGTFGQTDIVWGTRVHRRHAMHMC